MIKWIFPVALASLALLAVSCHKSPVSSANPRVFSVKGVIQELRLEQKSVAIKHEAVPDYMEAMTMPFKVKEPSELTDLRPGDEVTFRLSVTQTESWIDQIKRTGKHFPAPAAAVPSAPPTNSLPAIKITDIPDFALTNELGQPVSLRQFPGQAIALTFFFTRCPVPDYCPRLSRNFESVSQKLSTMAQGPTNWQLLSISFDPLDRPEVLKAYGERYHYDPHHWSFLTGNPEQIRELTRGFGVRVTNDGFFYSHDFATAVFDATGKLQALWRFGGDTSEILVNELLKATAAPRP
jgi:protein SCO1